jgi:uncharacterized damage-inducible protein DinB
MVKPSFSSTLREHLARVLDWEDAHASFDKAVDGIPEIAQGARANGFPHSPWELLEHLRLAQEDILEFCTNPAYAHTKAWPGDYWPATAAPPTPHAWTDSIDAYLRDREALKRIAREVEDLTEAVPTGSAEQTYLRAILLVADHTAYHVGQLVAVRRALGIWP